uniref:Uncharacterized protein n=1 Tax=Anguilla anguilla TaxID=7936 RepID=A0A0E9WBA1_ANGAN
MKTHTFTCQAVCISALLYSWKTWTICSCRNKLLEVFHIGYLQCILGITRLTLSLRLPFLQKPTEVWRTRSAR